MDRAEFAQLVRDALANLYDFATLETHPLAAWLPKPPGQPGSRADRLRAQLLDAIEGLRPREREYTAGVVEWRPYLILHGRYVEGATLRELQDRLGLSERQLRREHSRALQAVTTLLWDQALLAQGGPLAPSEERAGDDQRANHLADFQPTLEPLDLAQVTHSVASTLQRRVQSEGAELRLVLPQEMPRILADRVILRQILFSLLDYALDARSHSAIVIDAVVQAGRVSLEVNFAIDDQLVDGEEGPLEAARYWAQRLDASLGQEFDAQSAHVHLILTLPRADQPVILVVDDQRPAVQMFQRYLGHANVRVVGVQEGTKVVPLARQIRPQAITLDIMMPNVDGWEILQALQADPETRPIPVIICSVWDEPELASSLGAADFLKKPITQRDLLDALARVGALDRSGGLFREDSPAQKSARCGREGGAS